MRTVTITEKNIKYVCGMLKKFFSDHDIIGWHQFDCGMKKRIGHHILIEDPFDEVTLELYDTKREFYDISVRGDNHFIKIYAKEERFYEEDRGSFLLDLGDKVSFLGNRIIIKSNFTVTPYHYLYQCFQINK